MLVEQNHGGRNSLRAYILVHHTLRMVKVF